MSLFRLRLLVLFLIIINGNVHSQNKIYFTSGVITCEVTDITSTTVTYLPLQSSKEVTKDVSKVLLIFNDKGAYVVPSKMNFSLRKTNNFVTNFINNKIESPTSDMIYKTNGIIISEAIEKEEKNTVYLVNGNKIDKESIAAIIYKDGRHEIIGTVVMATDILWTAIENNFSSNQSSTVAKKDTITNAIPKAPVPTETKSTDTSKKIVPVEAPTNQSSQNTSINDSLPIYDKEEFKKKATDKVLQFTYYVKTILDKKADIESVNKAIELCFFLFKDENATVEVSSLNRASVRRKIRDYLTYIKLTPYDNVEVKWTNVSYVTDLHKGPDGNYYGLISFEQEFKGITDGKIVYQDITKKNAKVILKSYEKIIDGKTESRWDVLLGDIGVELTRSL